MDVKNTHERKFFHKLRTKIICPQINMEEISETQPFTTLQSFVESNTASEQIYG